MLRTMIGFQVFLIAVFLIGIEAQENPLERCMSLMKLEEQQLESMIEMSSVSLLNYMCSTVTSFLRCMNEVVEEETGLNLKLLAEILEGSDIGKTLRLVVNVQDLLDDICTEGSELREEYLANAPCFDNMDNNLVKECEEEAKDAYWTFQELNQNAVRRSPETAEPCVVVAYQFGCLGAAMHEECGESGFETYKKIMKKVGFFKIGFCSSEIMESIKGDFLSNLPIKEPHKDIYRVILDLKRRRK